MPVLVRHGTIGPVMGVYEVERMRTIALMAALFNMNNKKLGRDTMQVAEKAKVLVDEQGGGRKDRNSNTGILSKTVTMDISRQLRLAMANAGLDLKEGFDRLPHSVTMLSMTQHGAPEAPLRSTFETVANAKHFVLTALGRSKNSYAGRKHNASGKFPPQGPGQGSGQGPCNFGVYSSTLIKAMRRKGHGAVFTACISLFTMFLVCFMFVDDAELQHTSRDVNETGEDQIAPMQASLDHWCGLVGCTGGAINPEKSHWCLIDYKWTGTRWVYRTISEMPGELTAVNLQGNVAPLKRVEANEGMKTLGAMVAADGSTTAEVAYLKDKAVAFADDIKRPSPTSRTENWLAYQHTICKTMEYPYARHRHQRKRLELDLSVMINKATLPKCGLIGILQESNVLYGPKEIPRNGRSQWNLGTTRDCKNWQLLFIM